MSRQIKGKFCFFLLNRVYRCVLDIVNVTDHMSPSADKVQVYISGALHGNERLGPHAAYYLIELLVTSEDPYITNLLKTREIIITPMTNSPGFRYNQREEQITSYSSIDINRDFPYNTL
jgi:predicted deacylase